MEEKVFKSQGSYAHLMQGLRKQFPSIDQGDSSLFQFVATPKTADWTKKMDASLYQLMDTVPAERGGYYVPSEQRVSLAYKSLLGSLSVVSLSRSKEYMEKLTAVETLEKSLEGMREELKVVYMDETGADFSAPEFNLWLRGQKPEDPFANPKVSKYLRRYQEYQDAKEDLEKKKKILTRDYEDALHDMEDEELQTKLYMEGKESGQKVPDVLIAGNLAEDVLRWERGNEPEVKIQIKSGEKVEGMQNSVYSSGVGKAGFWLTAFDKREITQEIADEKYRLDISIQGINTYEIQRGAWYKGQYVNPAIAIDDAAILDKRSYFGEGGSLQLIPTSLLVIYKPTITLTIHRDVYQRKIRDLVSANSFLTIFGLGFQAGASIDQKLVKQGEEIVIPFEAPINAAPQILGITSVKKYL